MRGRATEHWIENICGDKVGIAQGETVSIVYLKRDRLNRGTGGGALNSSRDFLAPNYSFHQAIPQLNRGWGATADRRVARSAIIRILHAACGQWFRAEYLYRCSAGTAYYLRLCAQKCIFSHQDDSQCVARAHLEVGLGSSQEKAVRP